jgi:GNAT superfamily N-acetyltransferase
MIQYNTATTREDLVGILKLQKANFSENLTQDEIERQGFVTVRHSFDELRKLNDIEKHIIAKDEQRVIAYILAMTADSKFDLPVLIPMFELFDNIKFAGKSISSFKYLVVGQVCVAKNFRGQGIIDRCYEAYKAYFKGRYDFAITEIVRTNQRSLRAHQRIGFQEIYKYKAADETEWSIVVWDWNNISKSSQEEGASV